MTALHAPSSATLDESARTFIASFMSNVATVSRYGRNRIATTARVETLLLTAITDGEGASSRAWRALYRAVGDLLAMSDDAADIRRAHIYLRSFLRDNEDLAHV